VCRIGLGVSSESTDSVKGCDASLKDACGEGRGWRLEALVTAARDFYLSLSPRGLYWNRIPRCFGCNIFYFVLCFRCMEMILYCNEFCTWYLQIQGPSQGYRESGFSHRKPESLHFDTDLFVMVSSTTQRIHQSPWPKPHTHSAPALRGGGGERCGRPGPRSARAPLQFPYLLHTYCKYKSKGKNIVRAKGTIEEMPTVHAKSQWIPSWEAETSHWLALSSFLSLRISNWSF
jgi:hypothetical protein